MTSSIEITFNEHFTLGATVSFDYTINGNTSTSIETWVNFRGSQNTVTVGDDPLKEVSAANYAIATNLDLNTKFTVTSSLDKVTLTAVNDGVTISNFQASMDATRVIDNVPFTANYNIESVTYSPATTNNVCTHVTVDVVSNVNTVNVLTPVALTPNATNWSFEIARGSLGVTINADDGTNSDSRTEDIPSVLNTPSVMVTPTPSGGNVNIGVSNTDLTLEYSLNGTNYVPSGNFTGIPVGTRTAYVRDQFGCVKTLTFTVDAFVFVAPERKKIAHIPYSMPLRFAESQTVDYKRIYPTVSNKLSCGEEIHSSEVIYKYQHPRQPEQIETIRVHSSYETVEACLIVDGVEINLTPEKLTNNLNQSETVQGFIYDIGGGKTGIYFDTFPSWATLGFNILVANLGGYYTIEKIYNDSLKGKKIVEFTSSFTGTDTATNVDAQYNVDEFEVYKIQYDYTAYADKELHLGISFKDSVFTDKVFISEEISVSARQKNTVLVQYTGQDNGEIYFGALPEWFETRYEFDYLTLNPETDSENDKTDSSFIHLGSDYYSAWSLRLNRLTTAIADQANRIFGHEILYINGERYVLKERGDTERLGSSNFYSLEIQLYKLVNSTVSNEDDNKTLYFPPKFISVVPLVDDSGQVVDSEEAILV